MLLGSRYIHINSSNRDSGSITKFNVNFPSNMFNIDFTKCYLKMNLEEINIKYSWYNINSTNNKFAFYDGTTTQYLDLDEGNYNVNEMLAILKTALALVYTVYYNANQNKFRFVADDSRNSFTSISLGWMLGIEDGIEYVGNFQSIKPITMQYADTLYLHCDMPRLSDSVDNINSNKFVQSTIISSIPITVKPFDNIHYKPCYNTNQGIFLALQNFDGFNFWIKTDKNDVILNHDYCFTLKVEIYPYYRKLLK